MGPYKNLHKLSWFIMVYAKIHLNRLKPPINYVKVAKNAKNAIFSEIT